MLQSSFEGAFAPQKVRWFLRFIVFVLDFGVLWIRAKGRHTYPSSGEFETQGAVYDRVVVDSEMVQRQARHWHFHYSCGTLSWFCTMASC